MGTEKLLKAVISGPVEKLDDALGTLVLDREFHPVPAADALKSIGKLESFSDSDPYQETLDAAAALLQRLGVTPAFREYEGFEFALADTRAYISAASAGAARLVTHRNAENALASDNRELIRKLVPFSELTVDLADLLEIRYLDLRFGSAELTSLPALSEFDDREPDVMLFRTGRENGSGPVRLMYLALPDSADRIAEEMDSRGFEFLEKPEGAGLTGVPGRRIEELTAEAAAAENSAGEITEQLHARAQSEHDELLSRWSWLKRRSAAFALRQYAARKGEKFYVSGWVPAAQAEDFERDAAALGVSIELEKPGIAELGKVPVKFTDSFINRIFAPFVEMYGYPTYGESDPRAFMTITYALLFGIMFGDIGQGACLFLVGLLLKKKGSWLGRIMMTVSVSSVIFGCVYGSVFGNEHLLPGFKVLEGGNIMTMLIAAVVVGVAIIIACGLLNIMTGFRQHDYKKAIFSANGIVGLVFYVGVIAGAAGTLLLKTDLFGNVFYLVFVIILPLLLLWAGEPLVWLMSGKKGHLPSVGMIILEGFFDIFEACLSWFSNSVSFLRVGAYAICHAGMMMVVYLLSGSAIWGLVLGNALVMVVEAVLVCIQVLRLEFYEMFGRFYSGLGSPFRTHSTDYSRTALHS